MLINESILAPKVGHRARSNASQRKVCDNHNARTNGEHDHRIRRFCAIPMS